MNEGIKVYADICLEERDKDGNLTWKCSWREDALGNKTNVKEETFDGNNNSRSGNSS